MRRVLCWWIGWGLGADSCSACCWVLLSGCFPGPGLAPAGEVLFFASPKKSTQKKGDPQSATPSLALRGRPAAGRLRGAAAELTARLAALRSDSRGESEHEACVSFGTHAHPASTPPQAQPAGGKQPHTGHCFARPGTRALRAAAPAVRSDGPCGSPPPSVRAEKRRAAGACVCRRTHALRALTCRSMFERSAPARSEFCGSTHRPSIAGCP